MNKLIYLALLFFLFACQDEAPSICDQLDSTLTSEKIFSADTCSKDSRLPVAALLAYNQAGDLISSCSGALISINDVLTAGSCLNVLSDPALDVYYVYLDGRFFNIAGSTAHPNFTGLEGDPHNIAIISLTESVPLPPLPILKSRKLDIGEKIRVLGFGLNDDNLEREIGPEDLRAAQMQINSDINGVYIAESGSNKSFTCNGDEGGPGIVSQNGVLAIASITGTSPANCSSADSLNSNFVSLFLNQNLDFILTLVPDASTL